MTDQEKLAQEKADNLLKTVKETSAQAAQEKIEVAIKGLQEKNQEEIKKFHGLVEEKIKSIVSTKQPEKTEPRSKESALKGIITHYVENYLLPHAKGAELKNFQVGNSQVAQKGNSTTDIYTGDVLAISDLQNIVALPDTRLNHLRSFANSVPTNSPFIVYMKATDYKVNANFVGENGVLTQSSFKFVSSQFQAKRYGTKIILSNDLLNSENTAMIVNDIYNQIIADMPEEEDGALIYGDGVNDMVKGLIYELDPITLTSSIAAGAVASVATYNSGAEAVVTFKTNHNLNQGQKITISGATAARYNATFDFKVLSALKILIKPAGGYTAESDLLCADWAIAVTSKKYQTVPSPNIGDAILCLLTEMKNAKIKVDYIVANSGKLADMYLAKDEVGQYVMNEAFTRTNGQLYCKGIPVVEADYLKDDDVIIGNWARSYKIADFVPLSIKRVNDDTTAVDTNMTYIYVQASVASILFNKFLLKRASIADTITAITKPA